jgi:phosphoglycolate phosphatase-like HAD superfamily hydrolase
MIHAAMKWAGIGPFDKKLSKVLMVGDMDTDEAAAKAAGVGFKRAPDFFI